MDRVVPPCSQALNTSAGRQVAPPFPDETLSVPGTRLRRPADILRSSEVGHWVEEGAMKHRTACVVVLVLVGMAGGTEVSAQEEAEQPLENLQFFSPEIGRDSLIQVMRRFSLDLGVRCQYCHVGGDGVSFEGVDFTSDDDPDKRKARFMLRMVQTLNHGMLPLMADRDEPTAEVGCKTCHRGAPKPALLTELLRAELDAGGPDSTVALYRTLREQAGTAGRYDFGEWEVNLLAERLAREGRIPDAITIYEINLEQYPTSLSIILALGSLYEEVGDADRAVTYYERALELDPQNGRAAARLEALRGR